MGDVFRVDMDVPKSGQQKSPVQIDHLSITGVRGPMAGKLLADYIHTGHRPQVLAESDPARCVTEDD